MRSFGPDKALILTYEVTSPSGRDRPSIKPPTERLLGRYVISKIPAAGVGGRRNPMHARNPVSNCFTVRLMSL